MDGLPKLPGLDFEKQLKLHHNVQHCFDMVNGYLIPKTIPTGIGGDSPATQSSAFTGIDLNAYENPYYGCVRKPKIPPFRPHYVLYDKKILTFKAFFKQSVPESPKEHYRVRFVNILYFLEDDTISVMEPVTANSGFPQGRLIRRCKITKNQRGEYYNWKDFNIGVDVELNGIVFHITDCDLFTKDFLTSQGVELRDTECSPVDPVTIDRAISNYGRSQKPQITSKHDDKLRRFLQFQGKILQFDCILDETDRPNGECLTYKLCYFLEDDTVSIKELKENQEGRDRFPLLLRRTKLPKNWKRKPINFPQIYLEVSDEEVQEYYSPSDLKVGETIFVLGRRFLLLDCDKFTRSYYEDVLKMPQGEKLTIVFPKPPSRKQPLPSYLGLGTPEDSMASCYNLRPKTPKKDVIKYLVNTSKYLRYGCVLDSPHPEDKVRKFILSYSLADDTIKIMEPPIRNSGVLGGKFLSSQRVRIPNCNPDDPVFYGPKDFYIGAILNICDHRFKIVSADLYVHNFMREHPELFTTDAINSVRSFLVQQGTLKEGEKLTDTDQQKSVDAEAYMSDIEQSLNVLRMHDNVKEPAPDLEVSIKTETADPDAGRAYKIKSVTANEEDTIYKKINNTNVSKSIKFHDEGNVNSL